jgi:MFS family permease
VNALSSIAALLISVLLLLAGNALIGVLTPLRASLIGFSDLTIGLLGSVYFAGMLAGTLAAPAIVRRVGHIRAFSVFVAVAIVAVILMPGWERPAAWMLCRCALGFVFAGIYAVIESWINAKADNASRGALYGVYQIVTFAASAGGQLVLRDFAPDSFLPFSVAGALLALGMVPLAMTSVDPPVAPKSIRLRLPWLIRLAPVSALGALVAGVANGALFALGPVYALQIGVDPPAVPLFTAAIVAGSALGVYPAGRISDQMDRRAVMVATMTASVAVEIALASFRFSGAPLITMGFLVGLTTYTLYTLAVSHANDRAKLQDMVAVSAGVLFIYCVGAILSPLLASLLMRQFGPAALFVQASLVHAIMAAFALWRLLAEPKKPRAPAAATP